ncbi:hypothetical protein Droror1_Dr00018320, partial [Drosera rotundifolia]
MKAVAFPTPWAVALLGTKGGYCSAPLRLLLGTIAVAARHLCGYCPAPRVVALGTKGGCLPITKGNCLPGTKGGSAGTKERLPTEALPLLPA